MESEEIIIRLSTVLESGGIDAFNEAVGQLERKELKFHKIMEALSKVKYYKHLAADLAKYNLQLNLNKKLQAPTFYDTLTKKTVTAEDALNRILTTTIKFNKAQAKSIDRIKKQGREIKKNAVTSKSWFDRFQIGLLGVMFAGKQMSDFAKTELGPAMSMVGVPKLEEQIKAIKYLPTAIKEYHKKLEELGDVLNQPPEERAWRGFLVELIGQLGKGLSTVSSFGLAVWAIGNTIKTFFGPEALKKIVGGVKNFIGVFASGSFKSVGLKIGLIALAVMIIYKAFKAFFIAWTQDWSGSATKIKDALGPLADVMKELGKAFNHILDIVGSFVAGVVMGVLEKLAEALEPFSDSLGSLVDGLKAFNALDWEKFAKGAFEIGKFIGQMVGYATGTGIWVIGKIVELLVGLGNALGSIFGGGGGNVRHFATGGIVTQPTFAMIGENGPEAVVPLGGGTNISGVTMNVNVTSSLSTDQIPNLARELADAFEREVSVRRFG